MKHLKLYENWKYEIQEEFSLPEVIRVLYAINESLGIQLFVPNSVQKFEEADNEFYYGPRLKISGLNIKSLKEVFPQNINMTFREVIITDCPYLEEVELYNITYKSVTIKNCESIKELVPSEKGSTMFPLNIEEYVLLDGLKNLERIEGFLSTTNGVSIVSIPNLKTFEKLDVYTYQLRLGYLNVPKLDFNELSISYLYVNELSLLETLNELKIVGAYVKELEFNECMKLHDLRNQIEKKELRKLIFTNRCSRVNSLRGFEEFSFIGETKLDLRGTNVLTSQYYPKNWEKTIDDVYHSGRFLEKEISDTNYFYSNLETVIKWGYISLDYLYEAFVYMYKKFPDVYNYMKETYKNGNLFNFTEEQVKEIYDSDLINVEDLLVDAVAAGLPMPSDLLVRMKKYDHSEYRDSKLDSEWKDVF